MGKLRTALREQKFIRHLVVDALLFVGIAVVGETGRAGRFAR